MRGKYRNRTAGIFIAAVLFAACGNNPPEILQTHYQLYLVQSPLSEKEGGAGQDESGFEQELSLFVTTDDEDGPDELEFIYFICDEAELFWELNNDNWEKVTLGTDTWYGASRIKMPPGEGFPGKQFRIVLVDKGGQRAEQEMTVGVKTIRTSPEFPSVSIIEDRLILASRYNDNIIRIFNKEGDLLGEVKTSDRQLSLNSLLQKAERPDEAESLAVYSLVPEGGYMLKTRPVSLLPRRTAGRQGALLP